MDDGGEEDDDDDDDVRYTVKTHLKWHFHYNPWPGFIGMPQYTQYSARLVLHGQKVCIAGQKVCPAILWHATISGSWVIVAMPL